MSLYRDASKEFGLLKPVTSFAHVECDYRPDQGIIIEFENNDARHRVLLTRDMARRLEQVLSNVEFSWRFHEQLFQEGTISIEES